MLLFLRQDFFLLLLLSAFMSFIALCIRRVALLLGGIMVVVPYCAIYIIALLALFVVLFLYHQFDSFIDLFLYSPSFLHKYNHEQTFEHDINIDLDLIAE